MKGIIIYQGRYGATRQYAEWLQEALKIPAFPAENVPNDLPQYDFLLIGSSVYIGKLEIRHWFKKNSAAIGSKKIFFFLVSGTPHHETEKLEAYLRSGISNQLRQKIEVFFLAGRLNIKKLSLFDRFMLRMGATLTRDKEVKKGMLTDYNHVKKENLSELIARVKTVNEPHPGT